MATESNLALTLPPLHSSSSSSSSNYEVDSSSSSNYEVFLSFRGTDTRKNFTDQLYTALIHNGIRTFRDEEELQIGEPIMPNLLKVIQESRILIPIISPNYASSRLCLEELAKIMECKRTIGQIVMPIFFHVDVGDVKNQTGSFADAFCSHEMRFQMNKVMEWRNALREVGKLKGYDSKNVENGYESKLIQLVVKVVLSKLNNTPLDVAQHEVGIDSRRKMTFTIVEIENKKTMQEVIEVVSDIDGVLSVMAVMTDKMNMELTVRGHVDIIPEMIMEELKVFLGTEVVTLGRAL